MNTDKESQNTITPGIIRSLALSPYEITTKAVVEGETRLDKVVVGLHLHIDTLTR